MSTTRDLFKACLDELEFMFMDYLDDAHLAYPCRIRHAGYMSLLDWYSKHRLEALHAIEKRVEATRQLHLLDLISVPGEDRHTPDPCAQ